MKKTHIRSTHGAHAYKKTLCGVQCPDQQASIKRREAWHSFPFEVDVLMGVRLRSKPDCKNCADILLQLVLGRTSWWLSDLRHDEIASVQEHLTDAI